MNFLLAGGTTLLSFRVVVLPMIVARGEKANALADVANRANSANFFMTPFGGVSVLTPLEGIRNKPIGASSRVVLFALFGGMVVEGYGCMYGWDNPKG